MITLTQALLLALLYWITQTNYWLTNATARFSFPVVCGLFIGVIMGDPIQGTILGGILQTMNMAPSSVGSTTTMDLKMASFIAIPMCIAGNVAPEIITAFAVPFTVIGAFLQPVTRTLNQIGIEMADRAAAKGNTKLFYFVGIMMQPIIQFPFYFGVMFVALYYGQNAMSMLLTAIPEWLMVSFITLAKFLPGIGFAMFLKSINRKDLLPLFFLGFYIMYYLGASISVIGITIFAIIIAILWVMREPQIKEVN